MLAHPSSLVMAFRNKDLALSLTVRYCVQFKSEY